MVISLSSDPLTQAVLIEIDLLFHKRNYFVYYFFLLKLDLLRKSKRESQRNCNVPKCFFHSFQGLWPVMTDHVVPPEFGGEGRKGMKQVAYLHPKWVLMNLKICTGKVPPCSLACVFLKHSFIDHYLSPEVSA